MNRAVIDPMLEERAPGDIGGKLRESRERRGMTLHEVASSTKLPFRTLKAIERNDIAQLPGGIFSRSFHSFVRRRSRARSEQAVREFITQFPDRSVASRYPAISPSAQTDDSERRRAWTSRLLIGLGISMAAALLFVGGPAGGSTTGTSGSRGRERRDSRSGPCCVGARRDVSRNRREATCRSTMSRAAGRGSAERRRLTRSSLIFKALGRVGFLPVRTECRWSGESLEPVSACA